MAVYSLTESARLPFHAEPAQVLLCVPGDSPPEDLTGRGAEEVGVVISSWRSQFLTERPRKAKEQNRGRGPDTSANGRRGHSDVLAIQPLSIHRSLKQQQTRTVASQRAGSGPIAEIRPALLVIAPLLPRQWQPSRSIDPSRVEIRSRNRAGIRMPGNGHAMSRRLRVSASGNALPDDRRRCLRAPAAPFRPRRALAR
jgi:hypothetical protein